ncbi:hypothetical protein F5146DRAFT_1002593 [Armillaria mellea]|nr:hypothetical protein F5146DRAFT_1002593 [Armillaria mellea]
MEDFLARFLPPPEFSAREIETWNRKRTIQLKNKLNNLSNTAKSKALGWGKTQVKKLRRPEIPEYKIAARRGLQIRRCMAEALLEKASPEVQEEIHNLVLEDTKQKGKGLVPGSPPFITKQIELMDQKIEELKQIADKAGWVFTILHGGLMPGQMDPVGVTLNHGGGDLRFSSHYEQFEDHVAAPFRRFLCDIFTMEKCENLVKEMATYYKPADGTEPTDSGDNDTAEKSADEGGDSTQAMSILDALKQSFAMSQAQDLSTEFADAQNKTALAAVLVDWQARTANPMAMKATNNEARSKGKSRAAKGEITAIMISLLKHVFRGLTEEHHTSKPQYNSVFLFLRGFVDISDDARFPAFCVQPSLKFCSRRNCTARYLHPYPRRTTSPLYFGSDQWQIPSWNPMEGGNQENPCMDLSIKFSDSHLDTSNLFKELVGQEPGNLCMDRPDTSMNESWSVAPDWGNLDMGGSRSWQRANSGEGNSGAGGAEDVENNAAEEQENVRSKRFHGPLTMHQAGSAVEDTEAILRSVELGEDFEHCVDKWKEVELCLSVPEGKLPTSGHLQVLPGLLGKKLGSKMPTKSAPDFQDTLIKETLHWWNGLQDESQESKVPSELPIPDYKCDM